MLKKYLVSAKAYFRLQLDRLRNHKGVPADIEFGPEQEEVVDHWLSELNKNGFIVIDSFLDADVCADAVKQVGAILDQ